jgi:hypothetical protein
MPRSLVEVYFHQIAHPSSPHTLFITTTRGTLECDIRITILFTTSKTLDNGTCFRSLSIGDKTLKYKCGVFNVLIFCLSSRRWFVLCLACITYLVLMQMSGDND